MGGVQGRKSKRAWWAAGGLAGWLADRKRQDRQAGQARRPARNEEETETRDEQVAWDP